MKVIWMTGLSGAGKTTIALELKKLLKQKYRVKILDSDNIRNGLNKDLGFSLEDRLENVRRIAEVAKLFSESKFMVICCFISPTEEIRKLAKSILGKDYYEVYVKCSLETCEQRDVKGLYKKARAGEIKEFTGIDSIYEEPINPDFIIDTENMDIYDSMSAVLEHYLSQTL